MKISTKVNEFTRFGICVKEINHSFIFLPRDMRDASKEPVCMDISSNIEVITNGLVANLWKISFSQGHCFGKKGRLERIRALSLQKQHTDAHIYILPMSSCDIVAVFAAFLKPKESTTILLVHNARLTFRCSDDCWM